MQTDPPLIPAEPMNRATAKLAGELNALWAKQAAQRQKHAAEAARLTAIGPLNLTEDDLEAARANRRLEIRILQAEVPILKRYASEWPAARLAAREVEYDRAGKARQAAVGAVVEKLKEIGFDVAHPMVNQISALLVEHHATVAAASIDAEDAFQRLQSKLERDTIEDQIADAMDRLEHLVALA